MTHSVSLIFRPDKWRLSVSLLFSWLNRYKLNKYQNTTIFQTYITIPIWCITIPFILVLCKGLGKTSSFSGRGSTIIRICIATPTSRVQNDITFRISSSMTKLNSYSATLPPLASFPVLARLHLQRCAHRFLAAQMLEGQVFPPHTTHNPVKRNRAARFFEQICDCTVPLWTAPS